MRTRLSLLVVAFGVAIIAVACGRATQEEIDSALGITPTATLSAADIATGTADAVAAQETRTAAQSQLASPGAGGATVALSAAGDVELGEAAYGRYCLRCHRVNSPTGAPPLEGPESPAVALSDQEIYDLVRTGEGHAAPPGPLDSVDIPESQLINILAYIRVIAD